ncbi:MAG: hypothetical protein ACLSBB_17155 [Ruthenibacterium lactatiformans]
MHSLKRDKGYKIFSNIFLLLLVAVMVLPFVLLFMSSITEEGTLCVTDIHCSGKFSLRHTDTSAPTAKNF